MKRYLIAILTWMMCAMPSYADDPAPDTAIWFDRPATHFEEVLPLGNGRIGVAVYGGIHEEHLLLNEATLWSGQPIDPSQNPTAHEHLPEVRKAIFDGDFKAADRAVMQIQGAFSQSFAPLGDLWIEFDHADEPERYRRTLDLSTGVARVRYEADGVGYTREVFVSHPDNLLVMRFTSDQDGAIGMTVRADSQLQSGSRVEDGTLVLTGRAPVHAEPDYRGEMENAIVYDDQGGIRFHAAVRVLKTDGDVSTNDDKLRIEGAREVILVAAVATSFDAFDRPPDKDEAALAAGYLESSGQRTWDEMLERHLEDHSGLFDRVSLTLGKTSDDVLGLPTDARLKRYAAGDADPDLEALYFQFGRYLLMASSRTPEVPANLQGIWNPYMRPPWSSNYTANINVQMNYWPANLCNLDEIHEPLLGFIENLAQTGEVTARDYFDAEGWTTCHNTDIWAMTNPVGDFGRGHPVWANWCLGGAWFSTHLWEHYAFTQDKDFLAERAYPLMKGASEFCLSWLIEGLGGELVTAPSTSPENLYLTPSGYVGATTMMTTSDLAMIRELFAQTRQAAEELGIDEDFRERLRETERRLPPYRVGSKGQLLEWYHDWDDQHPEHRHVSHLFGVHPGHQITPEKTPALAAAVRRSLDLRTDGGTGWSKAWKINLWARLKDGNRAYKMLRSHLTYVDPSGETQYSGGGTFPNLWDSHPPFQIDGNFGATAGIAEMMLQSTLDQITLLPALPDAWPAGAVRGLRARGGFEVDIVWAEGRLVSANIRSLAGRKTTVRTAEGSIDLNLAEGEVAELGPSDFQP